MDRGVKLNVWIVIFVKVTVRVHLTSSELLIFITKLGNGRMHHDELEYDLLEWYFQGQGLSKG